MRLRKVICYVLFIAIMFMASMSTYAAAIPARTGSTITLKPYEADAEERRGRLQFYGILGEVSRDKAMSAGEYIAIGVEMAGIAGSQVVKSAVEYDPTKFELIPSSSSTYGYEFERTSVPDKSNIIKGNKIDDKKTVGSKERLYYTITVGTKSAIPAGEKDLTVYLFKAKVDTTFDFKLINGNDRESMMMINNAVDRRSFETANDLVVSSTPTPPVPPPNRKPVLTVTSPTSNVTLTDGNFMIGGTVSDADGDNVTVKATIGGVSKTITINTGSTTKSFVLSWTKDEIPVNTYSNIQVEAIDTKNAKGTAVWSYTLTVSDTTVVPQPNNKPVVAITTPGNDVYLKNGSFTLEGTVTDPENDVVTVSAIIGGITRSKIINTTSTTNYQLSWNRSELSEGLITGIQVSAVDSKSASSNATWPGRLFVQPTNKPPVVTLTGPTADVKLDTGIFTLDGTVVDPEGDSVTVVATIGTQAKNAVLSTTSSAWSVSFNKEELTDGYYTPTITATDSNGNASNINWGYTLTVGNPVTEISSGSDSTYVSPADLPLYTRRNGKKDGDSTTIKLTDRRFSYELRRLARSEEEEKVLKVKVTEKEDDKGEGYKLVVPSALWKSDKYDDIAINFITPFGEVIFDGDTLQKVNDREIVMEFNPISLDEANERSRNIEEATSAIKVTIKDKDGNDLSLKKPIQLEMLSDKKIVYPEILELVRVNNDNRFKYNLPIATDERKQKIFFEVTEGGDYIATYNFKKIDDYNDMIWAYKEMNILYSKHVIREEDATFRPQDQITRGEFTDLLVRTLRLYDGNSYLGKFVDVTEENRYYYNISLAKQNGIVVGVGQEMFADGEKLKREHMALMIQRTLNKLGVEDDGSVYDLTEFMNAEHVTEGYMTRAEAAVVLYRLMNLK